MPIQTTQHHWPKANRPREKLLALGANTLTDSELLAIFLQTGNKQKSVLTLAKELLAYVRGKYQTVPVPGSEATLNQADLLTDARAEKEALITNLREMLDQTSRQAQLERKANEGDNLKKTLGDVPMTIYIG